MRVRVMVRELRVDGERVMVRGYERVEGARVG